MKLLNSLSIVLFCFFIVKLTVATESNNNEEIKIKKVALISPEQQKDGGNVLGVEHAIYEILHQDLSSVGGIFLMETLQTEKFKNEQDYVSWGLTHYSDFVIYLVPSVFEEISTLEFNMIDVFLAKSRFQKEIWLQKM